MTKTDFLIQEGDAPEIANGASLCPHCMRMRPNWSQVNVAAEGDPPTFICTSCQATILAPARAEIDALAREAAAPQIEEALILAEINRTRDQLIEGGFTFAGNTFQSRQSDRENIAVMGQLAKLAIAAGSPEGNLRWAYPDQDFAFITASNTIVPMDAQTMSALLDRGVSFKADLTFYARALKDAVMAAETLNEKRALVAAADWPLEPPAEGSDPEGEE